MFEPVHGSAPDIAGQGIANPIAAILERRDDVGSSGNYQPRRNEFVVAVQRTMASGSHTKDLGGPLTTRDAASAVLEHVESA